MLTDHHITNASTAYPEVLTVKQAAQFLSLSTSTVYTYISKRKIPYVKRNGVVWLLKSRLMEWLLEGEKKTFKELST